MPLGYGSSLTTFSPKGQLRLRGSSLQRGCLSIGARRHYNAIRETRLCLCKVEPPSGAKGGTPLSPGHHFSTVFQKFPRQTLSCSDRTIAKNLRTKRLSRGQRAGRVARTVYASGLRQLPRHPPPRDDSGSEEVFFCALPRTRQRAQTRKQNGKRLRNTHT